MMNSKSYFKRYARVGPGGWRCHCCGPAPGKDKKAAVRQWKKTMNRKLEREIKSE